VVTHGRRDLRRVLGSTSPRSSIVQTHNFRLLGWQSAPKCFKLGETQGFERSVCCVFVFDCLLGPAPGLFQDPEGWTPGVRGSGVGVIFEDYERPLRGGLAKRPDAASDSPTRLEPFPLERVAQLDSYERRG
jgi:hypothetical protein